jgi:nicotinamide-nucleotide amidase
MNVEIINIGDELLIGQVVNTNASWMAEQLNLAGFRVHQVSIVGDDREHILEALSLAEKRANIILISGGIGPTKDDITKHTLCHYFNTELVLDEDAYHDVEQMFSRRGWQMNELNRQQAMLPAACVSIPNHLGTARGMWFEKTVAPPLPSVFVSMPGVPFEMKAMMTGEIIPKLKKTYATPVILHHTILTQGVGESFLAGQIEAWENSLPQHIKLAYLPQPGIVRLRLTGTGNDEPMLKGQIEQQVNSLKKLIPEYIYGYNNDMLEELIGKMLKEKCATLATAESCTGGYIAHLITSIPGSSAYFKGSVVCYANEVKEKIVGVQPETLLRFGAVSEETVSEMATGVQNRLKADYVIATSGIAGPDSATADKPVGTTWIAIATPDSVTAHSFLFGDSRERNIRRTALQALNLLRKELLKK